ncbi:MULTISPECIES: class I SAM-dependent methyltransferase [Paenibacillus]|uniref:Class I SAM-dependent methyltransferase n=1 Tax=Paenibacillus alvei TaxID=44250 RepID=A0ABT4E8D1_PAEAL|nr:MULTISPECIES: class I SAM-dependent methyltransferase [Paenibacillus]MCY9529993.1 class I SAM-dependent methyltransferase [Paenibacillus alvei]SDE80378.1 Methyltransferase domain-containing protein [Paenibacillus sp. cl6col]
MPVEIIYRTEHVFEMLDTLLKEQSKFNWDQFYSDRGKPIPFFVNVPDENLVGYFENKRLNPGKVLELGCGPGRNAIYLAERGCTVDAIDLSKEAIEWGKERAKEKELTVNFLHKNIFELDIEEASYDIVYDSGCLHHITPHRRISYLELINKALKPDGLFAITCFVLGGKFGGAEMSDWDVYRVRSLKGGLGFTEDKLKLIFHDFEVIEMRKMREVKQPSHVFGTEALLTALFKRKS